MSEKRNGGEEEECIINEAFRINLTTDSMRWDSLKIRPSPEFEENILQKLPSATFQALQQWHPIEVLLHDVDTDEDYSVKLAKKESFWFEPLPDVGHKTRKVSSSDIVAKIDELKEMKEEFAYSLQPFRHVIKKRSLRYDQEIGLVWSGSKLVNKFDFSILYSPRFGFKRQG